MNEDHHDFAYVITCYDPAIRDEVVRYLDGRFGNGNYFLDSDPGAVKNIVSPREATDTGFVLHKIQLAAKVHPFTHILVINHSACGAYADVGIAFTDAAKEETFHKEDMVKSQSWFNEYFKGIPVEFHYFLKKEQKMAW